MEISPKDIIGLADDLVTFSWQKHCPEKSIVYMESGIIFYVPEAQEEFDKIVDIIENSLNL
jgi:hypothetical protein